VVSGKTSIAFPPSSLAAHAKKINTNVVLPVCAAVNKVIFFASDCSLNIQVIQGLFDGLNLPEQGDDAGKYIFSHAHWIIDLCSGG